MLLYQLNADETVNDEDCERVSRVHQQNAKNRIKQRILAAVSNLIVDQIDDRIIDNSVRQQKTCDSKSSIR